MSKRSELIDLIEEQLSDSRSSYYDRVTELRATPQWVAWSNAVAKYEKLRLETAAAKRAYEEEYALLQKDPVYMEVERLAHIRLKLVAQLDRAMHMTEEEAANGPG